MKKIMIVLLILASGSIFAQKREIYGKVVDSVTKQGIENALVIAYPSGEKTRTRANGNFFLETEEQEGMFLQVMKEGYESRKITENLYEVYVELSTTEVKGQRVVVSGKRDEKKVVVSRQKVEREMIENTTTQLFEDSVQVIKTMPGVVSTNDFSSLMYVRGGDFYETASYLDNIYLLTPYIWGGVLSVFNPNMVESIDFYSGAFPAKYGPAMSGVLDVKMRDGNTEQWKGFAELSLTSFSSVIEGPLGTPGETRDSVLIGLRRTHYDLVANQFSDREGVQFPFFYDGQLRFTLHLGDSNVLRIFTLVSYEGEDVTFDDVEESGTGSEGWESGNEFRYKNFNVLQGFRLTTALSDSVTMENTLGYEYRYGDMEYVDQDSPARTENEWHILQYNSDWTFKFGETHLVQAGFQLYGMWYTLDLDMIQKGIPAGVDPQTLIDLGLISGGSGTDADPYLISGVPTDTYNLNWSAKGMYYPSLYLQDDIQLVKDTLFLNAGVRSSWLNVTNKYTIEPRGGIKLRATEDWTLKLAGGLYTAYPIVKNAFSITEEYGNTDLDPEKSWHLVFGNELDKKNWFFRLDFFGKYYEDLVTQDYEKNFVNGEIGYSYGFDLFIQKKISKEIHSFIDRFDGWIAYSYIIARRKVTDRISPEDYNQGKPITEQEGAYETPFEKWYRPEFDRPHNLNIILNFAIAEKWKIFTTTKIGSGGLYTPLQTRNVYQDTSTGDVKYGPIYGDYNSKRTDWYQRTDIKVSMPFFWDNWSSFFQIINVFGSENVESIYYDSTYTEQREQTGLPRFFVLGIRAEF